MLNTMTVTVKLSRPWLWAAAACYTLYQFCLNRSARVIQ